MNVLSKIETWLDDKLGVTQSNKDVSDIKQNAEERVSEVTKSLKKQGELQNLVINKTTTYYIGKAAGVIK